MPFAASYIGKTFTVSDPDARIRDAADLASFVPGPKRIPRNSQIHIKEVRTLPIGSKSRIVFALATSPDGATVHGWTSTRNFAGSFVNETLGLLPAKDVSDKFGTNAVWVNGTYKGQVDLVEILDSGLEIERMTLDTVEPYLRMVAAARADGITVAINSGFRSYPEQQILHQGFTQGLPGFNLAAPPGHSNHQNGIALDIAVTGGAGTPIYDWLARHATSFGFVRTVNREPWHWELNEPAALLAKNQSTHKLPSVTV